LSSETITEPARSAPVYGEFDVAVVVTLGAGGRGQ
jgi:hypothetical protein